jgi:hypothetical protein
MWSKIINIIEISFGNHLYLLSPSLNKTFQINPNFQEEIIHLKKMHGTNYYYQNLSNGLYNHITIKYVLFKTMFWKRFSIIKILKINIQWHKIYLCTF